VMQYQLSDGWTSVNFVRPAHGLVALYGEDVVPATALGLTAGRTTRGHRFEAASPVITLHAAARYAEQLADEGAVIADFADRRAELKRQIDAAAAAEGLDAVEDDALLDEVTALVERPNVLVCRFDREFLAVPQECLILTMKANQRYFPLLDRAGRLTEKFLVASNIRPADPSRVVEGNERVVRPRLADAKFFFDQDRKKSLASRVPLLAKVVYHGKLGSQLDRIARVRAIARGIVTQLGREALGEWVDRAALLAKADLLTDMVGEFPELQGVMGRYYAIADGEPEPVAQAIEDHYRPRYAGDELPRGEVGVVVALADKLEALAGLFGIGQAPTGDKDPFALRRHAVGIVRLLIERALPLRSSALLHLAAEAVRAVAQPASAELEAFIRDRLAVMARDQGFGAAEVASVLDAGLPDELWLVPKRLAAVRAFSALPEAAALAAANKRVGNILKKSESGARAAADAALLVEPGEIALDAALRSVTPRADAQFAAGDYTGALCLLAGLKAPVDAFFDTVLVNTDDTALRRNRLALLTRLHETMNRVADLSRLAV
jgi:glycyl-tRNA synthetase beta chain